MGRGPRPQPVSRPLAAIAPRAAVALALVSAALTGVLFLLVLMLVTGWSLSPLAAAAAMSVLPLAALAGTRIPGAPETRAPAGAAMVAAGVGALAFVPTASVAWVVVPQAVAGVGMGLVLPALAGELLPERARAEAARLLSLRITVALADARPARRRPARGLPRGHQRASRRARARRPAAATGQARRRGRARWRPRPDRPSRTADRRPRSRDGARTPDRPGRRDGSAGCVRARLRRVRRAGPARLRGAAPRRRPATAATATITAAGLGGDALAPKPARIADPCQERPLPRAGGLDDTAQDLGLIALDRTACELGSSREELALALTDDDAARAYQAKHGINPRSPASVIERTLGRGP